MSTTKPKNESKPWKRKNKNPFMLWGISPALHEDFKKACKERGASMKAAIVEFMSSYIKNA